MITPAPPGDMAVVAHLPCFISARGNRHQMTVFRSVELRDTDHEYGLVLDHAREHEMERVSVLTRPAAGMMFGEVQIEWFMTRAALRDGLLSSGGPDALAQMVDQTRSARFN